MTELCVCAEPLHDRATYPCGHALCINCTLKKRVLQKDRACPYCRAAADQVVVEQESGEKDGEGDWPVAQAHLTCTTRALQRHVRHILRFPCPSCDEELKTYNALKDHLTKTHKQTVCDVCTRHELAFSLDYALLSPANMQKHLKDKHVRCKFCHRYFYGTDEFAAHCRTAHVGCHVCERANPSRPPYFENYEQLLEHFRAKHFMCPVQSCLDDRFIVFGSEFELQHHMLEQHRGLTTANSLTVYPTPTASPSDTQDAADPQASSSSSSNNKEGTSRRYAARLEIDARHNQDIIKQIRDANHTFITKPIPVSVHVSTYERLLPDVPPREITALLEEFRRSQENRLSGLKLRELVVVIAERHHREEVEEKAKATLAVGSKKAPNPPPRTAGMGWSSQTLSVPRVGAPSSMANLPTLPSKGRPRFMTPQSSTLNYNLLRNQSPQIDTASLAPLGNKKPLGKSRRQPGSDLGNGPQTRVPTRERTRPSPWTYATDTHESVPVGSLDLNNDADQDPVQPRSQSQTQSQSQQNLRVPSNLPSLGQQRKTRQAVNLNQPVSNGGKKRILRLV